MPDSTKIQKSKKIVVFFYYILLWNFADMNTFWHILDSRADFLNLPKNGVSATDSLWRRLFQECHSKWQRQIRRKFRNMKNRVHLSITFPVEILLICTLSDTFWIRERIFWIFRKIVFLLRILYGVNYFKDVTENDSAGFDENPEIWKIACICLLHSLLKPCWYWHFLTHFEFASGFSESSEKIMFLLRILCGVYYFKNATENDSAGFDENPEIWKIVCIFLLHSLLEFCSYEHFLTHFGLVSGFSESSEKWSSCYGFSVALLFQECHRKRQCRIRR